MKKYSYKESFEYDINYSDIGIQIQEKYHLLSEIHRSENSIITKVTCKSSEEIYVLKAVRKRDDFIIELDRLKQLEVEGVNRVHEIFESEQFTYFIERYIEGINLEAYVHEKGVLKREKAKVIILKVAQILNRLHKFGEKGVIFRDLKPSNIMLTSNGDLILIDIMTIRESKENQTQDTFLIGSKGYTAPEAYGFMQTSVQSDIYSLGATLFFLLTGTQPANVSSFKTYFDENKTIAYKDIIEKATAFTPKDRFQNVDAFIDALNLGKVKKNYTRWYVMAFFILLVGVTSIYYLQTNTPYTIEEVKQVEDIDFEKITVLDQSDFKFESYADGLLKVYVNEEALSQEVSDFKYISVGTGSSPFSEEMIRNDLFLATTEEGYQLYSENGFNSALDDRKSIVIFLFSDEGEPIAYFSDDDVTKIADKINFNELNPTLEPVDVFEVAEGVIFKNYETYTVLYVDDSKVTSFNKVSIWNKHSPYAGKDIAKVQEKIENGENVVLYTEEGVKTDYGISGTFLGDYWLIYLLDENNNILSEYRTEGMYQISQPSLQIEKSVDLDDGVVLHVLGTYAKLELDQAENQDIKYVSLFQQEEKFTEVAKDKLKQSAQLGLNITEYTQRGVDVSYEFNGLFDDCYWYIVLLDENKNMIKEYMVE